jgi:HK97 family phage major capsid protein
MSDRIRTLEAAIQAKKDEIKKFFGEVPEGEETREQIEHIKNLNKQKEEDEHKLLELREIEGIKTASLAQTSSQVGTKSIQFPSGTGSLPESSGDRAVASDVYTVGKVLVENEGFKSWLGHYSANGRVSDSTRLGTSPPLNVGSILGARGANAEYLKQQMGEMKTLVTGAASTQAGAFIITDARPIVDQGTWARPLMIRDMITVLPTTSDTIDYVRFGTPTNNAATVAEATATSGASGTKPESALAFTRVSETIKTLAHWIPITRQALADAPQMRAIIDSFLRYGLDEELEDQIMSGNGVGENFTGILNTAGITAQAWDTNILTTTRKARTKVQLTGRATPTAYAFHPTDWETLDLLQDNEARYYFGGPSVIGNPRLWGLPVIQTEALPVGRGLVADWRFAVLWDRMATQILVSDSHSDFFIRNLLVILAELRAGFGLIRPSAFVDIDLTA